MNNFGEIASFGAAIIAAGATVASTLFGVIMWQSNKKLRAAHRASPSVQAVQPADPEITVTRK